MRGPISWSTGPVSRSTRRRAGRSLGSGARLGPGGDRGAVHFGRGGDARRPAGPHAGAGQGRRSSRRSGEGAGGAVPAAPALNVMTTSDRVGAAGACRAPAPDLTPDEAWRAAHVDEEFQEARWGQDAEAMERRARRWREMQAAAELARLA